MPSWVNQSVGRSTGKQQKAGHAQLGEPVSWEKHREAAESRTCPGKQDMPSWVNQSVGRSTGKQQKAACSAGFHPWLTQRVQLTPSGHNERQPSTYARKKNSSFHEASRVNQHDSISGITSAKDAYPTPATLQDAGS
eukprot:1138055-Pelagomonas_calceolata.AAC.1